ncbi:hypothetical protein FHR24_002150 [Wenyingzhuangia heitensis]|uniref:HmuY protein n=1 Tax=Wenyingzhuangia heitensis TaxID=1487859 RepID=A0ABX0UA35_9FLAO|nr:HmuY family protein [Wenyingzhuangia heitensis]NIJ45682.1 hypothetical protein [Wenyingzhuangia heitensis]
MKKQLFIKLLCALFVFSSCSNDDSTNLIDFTVSFKNTTTSIIEGESEAAIDLNFSRAAATSGVIDLSYSVENAVYGTDFTTNPSGENGTISIPVASGDSKATVTLTKLTDPIEGTSRSIDFTIASLESSGWDYGANKTINVSFTPVASTGAVIDLLTGGSTQPNQSYIDLSTGKQTPVKRDTWEIAVYNGTENRVFLNSSLLVAAAELKGKTDLLSVTETSNLTETLTLNSWGAPTEVATVSELLVNLPVGYSQFSNVEQGIVFTDSKEGNIDETAFSEISTTASENNVYIVSLGNEIPTDAAAAGALNTTGEHRGYVKVRVLTDGNSYTIRYADLNETTTYKELVVQKNSSKVKTAISLTNDGVVEVEPESSKWDLNFSGVFSYSSGGYGLTYSDYGLHNTLGNVGLYQVLTYKVEDDVRTDLEVSSYIDFQLSNVDDASFIYDNQTVIASDWRNSGDGIAKDDRYYIIKDNEGNLYKLRFTALLSSSGERGYSQFEYKKLN